MDDSSLGLLCVKQTPVMLLRAVQCRPVRKKASDSSFGDIL